MSYNSTFTTCQGCRGMSRIGPTPDLNRLLIQRAHRSQNSRFPGFQFPAGYVRCNHHPVAGAVRDMSSVRLFSPEWPALGCVSGVSIPLSSASTPSPSRHSSRSSDKSRSPRGHNSLSTFEKTESNAPILVLIDWGSSDLAQSKGENKKDNRKFLNVLYLVCIITDCFCDC